MDIKSKLDCTFENFKLLLIKTGFNFWINLNNLNEFHYVYIKSEFKTIKSNINLVSESFGFEENEKIPENRMTIESSFKTDTGKEKEKEKEIKEKDSKESKLMVKSINEKNGSVSSLTSKERTELKKPIESTIKSENNNKNYNKRK